RGPAARGRGHHAQQRHPRGRGPRGRHPAGLPERGCHGEGAGDVLVTTEIPDLVAASTITTWSDEVDGLVLRPGLAGTAAALQAAEAGARVLVLARGGRLSCTSAMAGGHFYLGGGTPVQEAGGFEDTPEEMAKYLRAVAPHCDEEKIRLYCEGSVEHFHWLEA